MVKCVLKPNDKMKSACITFFDVFFSLRYNIPKKLIKTP